MLDEFYSPVHAALQHQVNEAITAIKKYGVHASQGQIHGSILNTEIGTAVKSLYRKAAKYAAQKYHADFAKCFFGMHQITHHDFTQFKGASFGSDPDFIDAVMQYLDKFLLNKVIVPISQTTIDQIETVLQEAIQNGWSIAYTVNELSGSDITQNRARTIVRTETVRSTNVTQMAAADNEEFEMNKEWIAIEDDRTRREHTHSGVDGEIQQLYETFSNGLMFPGDPNGEAEQVINCRCTMGYFGVRDKSGNLVPKSRNGLNFQSSLNLGSL